MSLMRIRTGKRGEDLAEAYLIRTGFRTIERNYRCRFGEIDIIAEAGKTLIFVEVKSRRSEEYGEPQQAVDLRKRKKITLVAMHYMNERNLSQRPARFDVVAVKMMPGGSRIEHIQDAFELTFD